MWCPKARKYLYNQELQNYLENPTKNLILLSDNPKMIHLTSLKIYVSVFNFYVSCSSNVLRFLFFFLFWFSIPHNFSCIIHQNINKWTIRLDPRISIETPSALRFKKWPPDNFYLFSDFLFLLIFLFLQIFGFFSHFFNASKFLYKNVNSN